MLLNPVLPLLKKTQTEIHRNINCLIKNKFLFNFDLQINQAIQAENH